MFKHLNIKIYGEVQGVFFRSYAEQKARELMIKGFARNEADGTVYIEAEGEEKKLNEFLSWCRKGPEFAKVEKLEFEFSDELKKFEEFSVR